MNLLIHNDSSQQDEDEPDEVQEKSPTFGNGSDYMKPAQGDFKNFPDFCMKTTGHYYPFPMF
jgi:hypothetical protein